MLDFKGETGAPHGQKEPEHEWMCCTFITSSSAAAAAVSISVSNININMSCAWRH